MLRYLEEADDKRSLSDDRDHLRKLDPYLRSLRLDAIDMTVLQPFIRDRKVTDGVTNATVNRALEVVRRILNLAHQEWRWLKAVPRIRMLKEPRRRVRFLRREEADRLIEELPSHMKAIVRFALATGCRAGEIHGLEWSRVDLDRKVAWLDHGTTKSGEGRAFRSTRMPSQRSRRCAISIRGGALPSVVSVSTRARRRGTKRSDAPASRTSASTTCGTPRPAGTCRAAPRFRS